MYTTTSVDSPADTNASELASHYMEAREIGVREDADGPLIAKAILRDALHCGATDIHIDPCGDHYRIRFRVDGLLANVLAGESGVLPKN